MQEVTSVTEGSVISCHDVCYSVEVKKNPCCGKLKKQILTDIHGVFKPGMNALMGPTGSGKSSLLDVLAGRKDPAGLSGTVLVAGAKQPKNYKCISGYVVQDDVVMGTLSVRENLMFSAQLRLSSKITHEEKSAKVEDMISELGLEKCADSKIGNEFIRGVSGGERKRTAIGMELIVSPGVLFLDEPTTGLDAATSNSVIHLLNRLSRRGRTIIFSIHQPRFSIFRQFDRLMLLCAGQTVYHGPALQAIDFFESAGYKIDEHDNPPDFFLDVILGVVQPSQLPVQEQASPGDGAVAKVDHSDSMTIVEDVSFDGNSTDVKVFKARPDNVDSEAGLQKNDVNSGVGDKLNRHYLQTKWCSEIRAEADPIIEGYRARQAKNEAIQVVADYATSFSTQFRVLASRSLKNIIRDPQSSAIQFFILFILGVVSGVIYLQLDDDFESGIQNRVGAFFFIMMNQAFINVSAISVFIAERALFVHENISGFYRVSAYFLAKVFCDVLPMRILPLIIYSVITYFMIGFQYEVDKFFIYLLTLFCTTLSAFGISYIVSCLTRVFVIANLVTIMILIFSVIFGGLLINVNTIGDWISWVQYISIFRFGLKALYINELKDMQFCQVVNGTKTDICLNGNVYLDQQGIDYDTAWHLYQNHVALTVIGVGLLALAYVVLRNMKKLK